MKQTKFVDIPVGGLFLDQSQLTYTKAIMELNVYKKLDNATASNIYWTSLYNEVFKDYFDNTDTVLLLNDVYISTLKHELNKLQIKSKAYKDIIAKYCASN